MFEFFIFAFVTAITPGPNNSMLMASGIKFGRKASIPHFLGIWLGFNFHMYLLKYLITFSMLVTLLLRILPIELPQLHWIQIKKVLQ
jgi:threonine/homoserine/homoserine lactone efflux protein